MIEFVNIEVSSLLFCYFNRCCSDNSYSNGLLVEALKSDFYLFTPRNVEINNFLPKKTRQNRKLKA
jgi:hypothetical protein